MLRTVPGIRDFAGVLASRGYTSEGLAEKLRGDPYGEARHLPRLLWLTSALQPLDVLVRLLLIGVPAAEEAVRDALAPVPLESLFTAGVLARCGAEIAGTVQLYPHNGLYFAVDHPRVLRQGMRDAVMGLSQSTVMLDQVTIRVPCERALDLGAGAGVHTLLAARHAREAWGIEISPRALAFSRFNAALNGVENARFVEGDFFTAVPGERFGLIVANPPFVIAPGQRYLYRDSGMPLDGVSRAMLQDAPRRLEPGGFCHVLCQWVKLRGEEYEDRLAGWLRGSGCDAWILCTSMETPLLYAEQWIHDTETGAENAALFEEWAHYYEREGVEGIASGVVTLRRTDAANWIEFANGGVAPEASHVLLRNFELHDFERARSDDELLRTRLRPGRGATLTIEKEAAAAGWQTSSIVLRQSAGVNYTGSVDPNMAALLERCTGGRTLGEIAADLAKAMGASEEAVARACVPVVRRLMGRGFLEPVS